MPTKRTAQACVFIFWTPRNMTLLSRVTKPSLVTKFLKSRTSRIT